MKVLVPLAFLALLVFACKAMIPDYVGVTVGETGDGSEFSSDGHGAQGPTSASIEGQTFVALTIGYSPGDRIRHHELMRETERAWKKMVAAQDRAQIAFLTKTLVADQGDDALGNPVTPDLSDPIDVLVKVVPEVPKTLSETLMLLGWAIALAIVGATFYFLAKQHQARKKGRSDD